jgi:hypothetical protein
MTAFSATDVTASLSLLTGPRAPLPQLLLLLLLLPLLKLLASSP